MHFDFFHIGTKRNSIEQFCCQNAITPDFFEFSCVTFSCIMQFYKWPCHWFITNFQTPLKHPPTTQHQMIWFWIFLSTDRTKVSDQWRLFWKIYMYNRQGVTTCPWKRYFCRESWTVILAAKISKCALRGLQRPIRKSWQCDTPITGNSSLPFIGHSWVGWSGSRVLECWWFFSSSEIVDGGS